MVEIINSLEDLCRLCAGKIDVLMGLNIFASDHRQIFKKICVCLPIQISVDDSFPKMVCVECACKLDLMFDFRERSILTAHLFSDMLTVGSANGVINVNQNIPIGGEGAHSEPDFNNDFLPCKLDPLKYNTSLSTEVCTVTNENILSEESIQLGEATDLIPSKPKVQSEISDKKSNNLQCEITPTSNNLQCEMTQTVNDLQCEMTQTVNNLQCEMTQTVNNLQCEMTPTSDNLQCEMTPTSNNLQCEMRPTSDNLQCELTPTSNNFEKNEPVIPSKVYESTDDQNLSSNMPEKTLGTEKFEMNSIMGTGENVQNLNHSPELDWFFCNICNRTFEDRGAFESHNHDTLQEEKQDFECITEEELKSQNLPNKKKKAKQKKTGKIKKGDKKIESKICMECGKEYQTNYKLQEHMRKHTGEKPYLCSYQECKKAFRSKIGLAQHEANHSGQFEFSCSTCGKGFQCKSYLVVHQRVHSDLKPFICKQCSRRFKTKQSLLDHMNRHLGVKPFLCDICGRGFITKGLCKSHQKVHSGTDNRQYPCHVCRKLFVSKSYLNTHFRIHTGEKPFMCEVCGKGFLTRVDLRIHSTMHTGEKRFVCEMCGKAFARRDALRCHRRSHTGERPYKCEFCGQSFTQFSPMAIHKRLHTGERPYECDVCSKAFVSRSTMIAHRKKHHTTTNEDSRFQIMALDVQQGEMNGHEEQQNPEQIVVMENSPQLLLALSKRHSVGGEQSSDVVSMNNLKNEGSSVPVE